MATKPFYIHQKPPTQSFIRLPNFLFEAPSFCSLSNEAKLLYAMILRRTDLSRKNGWADDYGEIYLYYPINEVCELLHCGRQKAVDTLRELQYADLISSELFCAGFSGENPGWEGMGKELYEKFLRF